MNKTATGIVAYLTIVGWLIAYLVGDKENAKFHLNQALIVAIVGLVTNIIANIPIIGLVAVVLNLAVIVYSVLGIVYAAQDQDKALPFLENIQLLK